MSKTRRSKTKGQERGGVSVVATENLRIIADEANNALVIMAKPQDYKMIESALKRLDVIPLQVLIEASVVDITLTDNLQYGVEWLFRNSAPGSNNIGQGKLDLGLTPFLPGAGFSYALISGGEEVKAVLNALAAQNKLNVLSSPSLMVLDNQTALIEVVDEVPVTTQQQIPVDQGTQTQLNQLQSVEFKDVSVILEVTPRSTSAVASPWNSNRRYPKSIPLATRAQTLGEIPRSSNATYRAPSPCKAARLCPRRLDQREQNPVEQRYPVPQGYPGVGALFSATTDNAERQELMVLLTPRAVRDQAEARAVTEEFRHRLRELEVVEPGG